MVQEVESQHDSREREREREVYTRSCGRIPNNHEAMLKHSQNEHSLKERQTDFRSLEFRGATPASRSIPSDSPKGFPQVRRKGNPTTWCVALKRTPFSDSPHEQGAKINTVQYLGIAADEPERIERHTKNGIVLPLVDIGWTEADCRKWCEENDLLSPIYTTSARGGCWFCHNQGIEQLRLLRKNYPQLWELLLKWDLDSPVTFKADGHTVHDFDERFALEDEDKVPKDRTFRWWMVEDAKNNDQLTFDDL